MINPPVHHIEAIQPITDQQLEEIGAGIGQYFEHRAPIRIATAPTHKLLAEGYPALSSSQLARLRGCGVEFPQTTIEV